MPWLLALLPLYALAQDDDDIDDLDDDIDIGEPDEPTPKPAPAEPPDDEGPLVPDDDDDGLEGFRDSEDDTDLLGDEPATDADDTEAIFRKAQTRLSQLEADEELAGWEAYLERYPKSAFRKRIETRMEELEAKIYEIGPTGPTGPAVDAGKQEILFAHAMQLENLNPRTRAQVGFEWGLPDYVNLAADYEHQFVRNISAHIGVRRRYLGWNIETGGRFALVKSSRTNTIVSLIADVRLNTIPAYPGLRPQLAAGKRFGKLDAQIQGGVDVEYRTWLSADGKTVDRALQPNIVGGASLFYAASERVGMFAETSTYMRPMGQDGAFDGGLFRFNVFSFGMKFFPGNSPDRDKEVNLGATVPYTQQWWQFHYGSVMGQLNYYL